MPRATGPRLGDSPPRRVALLRALQLGDMLCAVPALRAFRAAWPDAEITLIGLAWARAFADRFDRYVDDFLELPGFPGLPEIEPRLGEIPPFLARAQGRRFDLAVQLHGSGSVTNPLVVLLGARRNAGFCEPGAYCPDPELFCPYPDVGHEIHRLLALPAFLALPLDGDELEFPLRPEDEKELRALGLASRDYVCIHPGARFEHRRWAPERFAAVADTLAARGLRVVLTGSPAEKRLTARVGAAMRAEATDVAGSTTLGSLAALLAGARLLVSNDTGVSHLAAALRVPSVVVVTTSDPDRWAPLDRELHRVVLQPEDARAVTAEAERQLGRAVAA